MQNGTGVGRKRSQDSSSISPVFSLCHLAFRNNMCSVSFVSLLGAPLLKEPQSSVESRQETEAMWVSKAVEQIPISACSGSFTLWDMWVCVRGAVWDCFGAEGNIRNTSLDNTQGLIFRFCACSRFASLGGLHHHIKGC